MPGGHLVRLDFFLRIFRLKKQQHLVSLTWDERLTLWTRDTLTFTCSGSWGVVMGALERSCVAPSSSLLRSMLVEPLLYIFSNMHFSHSMSCISFVIFSAGWSAQKIWNKTCKVHNSSSFCSWQVPFLSCPEWKRIYMHILSFKKIQFNTCDS